MREFRWTPTKRAGNIIFAILLLLFLLTVCAQLTKATTLRTQFHYVEGPCVAIHYGRPGHEGEISMEGVVQGRADCPTCTSQTGFRKRTDVVGYMAVKHTDCYKIGQDWRALVMFKLPSGGYSVPQWYQPGDCQAGGDVTSSQCRTELSEAQAAKMGWSQFANDRGMTTSYILRWER